MQKSFPEVREWPKFPPKFWVGNFDSDRLDERKTDLERFLNMFLNKAEIATSPNTRAYINSVLKVRITKEETISDRLESKLDKFVSWFK